jgi:hypothetical protein
MNELPSLDPDPQPRAIPPGITPGGAAKRHPLIRVLRLVALALWWLLLASLAIWATAALYFDLQPAAAGIFAVALVVAIALVRGQSRRSIAVIVGFVAVLAWWLSLAPRNDRDWQPDVAKNAWAEINGDEVTLYNVRNCEYRTETDYTPRWEKRTVRLSQITGIDLAINYWGSPWIAHPIASFQFADAPPLCFSIETRKEVGESYSAIRGLFRQFELIYIVADERDVLRVRTNFRQGEDVYLYRLNIPAARARERFLEYLSALDSLRTRPRWYNAITTNCTTSIRAQRPPTQRAPFDWRLLLNGKGDEMLFEKHGFVSTDLSFPELKAASRINPRAREAGDSPRLSEIIREDGPTFRAGR